MKLFGVLFVTILIAGAVLAQEGTEEGSPELAEEETAEGEADPQDAEVKPEESSLDPQPEPGEETQTGAEPPQPDPETADDEPENVPDDAPSGPNHPGMSRAWFEQYVDYNNWDSLTFRYAPSEESQRGGVPYVITEARLREIRAQFMYWFFDMGGNADNQGDYQNAIHNSNPQLHKNLNFQLPFFGFRFNYTRVSLNGYVEFSDPPGTYPTYPLVFPVKDWPTQNDPSFIGIFFSKCRMGSIRPEDVDQRKPGVYFRLERDLQTRTDQIGVEMRERLTWDIREAVIGADGFLPKHAVTVTWKNVSFAGGITNSLYVTNTFQMVLATDEVITYAIFNYLDLQWTTHTEAGGDTLKGEGGIPAYVGFNAGNGTRSYEYTPYSQASVIRDLTGRGWANGFKGRHIFRIDENILMGTCNKDIDGANLPLVFAPESGNMLGGTVVNITGPCFDPRDQVICKFDVADPVYGTVVDNNRAICVQPPLSVEGYVRLEIAIGAGVYKWKGQYFVETPATATEKIFFMDSSVTERSPAEIKIQWVKQNLTTNDNALVSISLWGYRETTVRPELLYIDTIQTGVSNTGEYIISPATYRNRDNRALLDVRFGFIQINLTESIPVVSTTTGATVATITPKIWSRPIPLGWYFGYQYEGIYGTNWPRELCNQWLTSDRYLKNFAHELPQCPCTVRHALVDKGRFMPDFDCDKDSNPSCQFHRGAYHCVKTGSPTLEGSEQQCCYDRNGYLMLSYDQQWGSSPRRAHNLGIMPWNEATKVPTLSQWYHDVIPRYFCCLWQEEQAVGCETFRFERRPTQDCVAYQAPAVAGVFGDPHFVTFDNLDYTFNGKGEFVLVRSMEEKYGLDVQGRFEQLPMSAYGEVRATQLTAVVARGNSSTAIEVRLRPLDARWRYRMDVLANGKRIYFDRPALKFQHFQGVTVYTPTYILNQSEVIMMFDTGVGVEVLENKGYMSARVFLPWTYINKTRGLLGNWSFDMTDDFTNPDGSKVSIHTNLNDFERIYNDFGMNWILDDNDDKLKGRALFHREFGRTSSYYNNRTFKPEFRMTPEEIIPANRSIQIEEARDLCGDFHECQYDYAMSLNRDLAHFTLNYKSTITTYRRTSAERVVSCGVLETPRFGRKSNFLFVPGTKVTYECNEGFILIGDSRRECLASGQWDVPVYGYTYCLRQQEYSSRQAGITFGIILAVIVPIITILAYIAYRLLKRMKGDDSSWTYKAAPTRLHTEDSRTVSPTDSIYKSPILSYTSSTDTNSLKKRRSYDKVYRTNEPLQGKPDVEFEEKPWDLDSSSPTETDSVRYAEPHDTIVGRHRLSSFQPSSPASTIEHRQMTASDPNLIGEDRVPSSPPVYASVNKEKKRAQSQSSVITDV